MTDKMSLVRNGRSNRRCRNVFSGGILRTMAYRQEGKHLHAGGVGIAAAGGAFFFFDGLSQLAQRLHKPSVPTAPPANGIYGEWEADGINGTICITRHDTGLHLLIPNAAGRFNVLSGGAKANSGGPFFATVGQNSRNQPMLSMGQLVDDRDLIETVSVTILGWDGNVTGSDFLYQAL